MRRVRFRTRKCTIQIVPAPEHFARTVHVRKRARSRTCARTSTSIHALTQSSGTSTLKSLGSFPAAQKARSAACGFGGCYAKSPTSPVGATIDARLSVPRPTLGRQSHVSREAFTDPSTSTSTRSSASTSAMAFHSAYPHLWSARLPRSRTCRAGWGPSSSRHPRVRNFVFKFQSPPTSSFLRLKVGNARARARGCAATAARHANI